MTPPPNAPGPPPGSCVASDPAAQTADPSQASASPRPATPTTPRPPTRASDLDASEAGLVTSAVPPDRVAASGRYVLTAFHARGGMGEVWRCRDATLGRDVALKRLVSERSAARERFLCEAQVAGQLQHPSIVPIHDLGYDDDGRPFYVMTFVEGRTLKAAIDALYGDPARPPEQRQVERTRLLKIFLDVCHAVAYAHSRGVIHRDVKPDNVMLGAYGETILLDWGLAKLGNQVDPRGISAASGCGDGESGGAGGGDGRASRAPALSRHSAQTEDGSILGSPLYMPPEMAHGRIVDADRRTDVYLLGATLYEILAGRPPRQGASRDEILELARTAPPVPPRQLQPDTPPALQAICLKAMATNKTRRYESAMDLAEDVQRFIAGEAVSAYPEPFLARAWRWSRRHRRGIARVAAAMVIVACGVTAVLVYRDAQHIKARELAREQVRDLRRLADEARYYGAGTDAPGELAPYYDSGRALEAGRAALASADRWGVALEGLPLANEREPLRRDLADLCQRLAQIELARGSASTAPQALELLDRAAMLAPDSFGRTSQSMRAQALRLAGRAEEAAKADTLAATSPAATEPTSPRELFLQAEQARVANRGQDKADVEKSLKRAAELYQAALQRDPADYWARLQLGRCYLALGRGPEAVEALGGCIALRPGAPWGYSARGLALALLRRFDEAKRDLDRALELDPNCLAASLNRGVMYRLQNRGDDAAAEFDALLARPNLPPPSEAAYYRAQLHLVRGEPAKALDVAKLASNQQPPPPMQLALLRVEAHLRLGKAAEAQAELARVTTAPAQRGHLLREIAARLPRKDQKAALEMATHELTGAAATAQPDPPAAVFADLGAVLHQQAQSKLAIGPLSRAIAAAPEDPQPLINRGWAREALNDLPAAAADFAAAIKLAPANAEAFSGLGYISARRGAAADAQRQASLALLHGGNDFRILHNVACIYAQLSEKDRAQAALHQDAAIDLLRRAIDSWQRGWGGPDELELIRVEVAFPPSMRQRADFQRLLADQPKEADGTRA